MVFKHQNFLHTPQHTYLSDFTATTIQSLYDKKKIKPVKYNF